MTETKSYKKPDEHEIEAYSVCLKEKQHYDSLSWQIGAITLVFVGFLLSRMAEIETPSKVLFCIPLLAIKGFHIKRLILWVFIVLFLTFWIKLYKRNSLWAEVANERARDFEREWGLEGVALKYMKVDLPKTDLRKLPRPVLILRNRDEKDELWRNIEKTIHGSRFPTHTMIVGLYFLTILLSLILCFIS
jgi:hypothetical protein